MAANTAKSLRNNDLQWLICMTGDERIYHLSNKVHPWVCKKKNWWGNFAILDIKIDVKKGKALLGVIEGIFGCWVVRRNKTDEKHQIMFHWGFISIFSVCSSFLSLKHGFCSLIHYSRFLRKKSRKIYILEILGMIYSKPLLFLNYLLKMFLDWIVQYLVFSASCTRF